MSANFAVRPATAEDVPSLVALVNSAYRGDSSRAGWTTEADLLGGVRIDAERLLAEQATAGHVILVHEEAGAIIACVHLERQGERCYLGMLTVKPTQQARGTGRLMLATAEAWATTHWQSRQMGMSVIVQREALVAWYERRGYAKSGETKPFPYGDQRFGLPTRPDLAFYVLEKALRPSPPPPVD